MSDRVSAWAWEIQLGDASAKLLLVKLANSANDDGICWPSQRTLARHCELGERSIRYKLELLQKKDLIQVVRNRRKDGRLAGNIYHLKVPIGSGLPVAPAATAIAGPKLSKALEDLKPLGADQRQPIADGVWDTLVELLGEPSNENTRGKRNRAVKLLKQSLTDSVDPEAEIRRRAGRWSEIFPGASFTDIGFANQWDALVPESVPSETKQDALRAMEEREREEREAEQALALPPAEQKKRMRELMESMDKVGKAIE